MAAELLGELGHRQAGRAAAGHQHRVTRVDPLVDRDVPHGRDHVLVGDGEDRPRGPLQRQPERLGHGALDRACGGGRVEVQPAAEEVRGIDVPERHCRVGDRRLGPAEAVARRAGLGAGALRTDAQQPAGVDPGDAAAAGTDVLDRDRRQTR